MNEWEDVRKKKEKQVKVVVGNHFLKYILNVIQVILFYLCDRLILFK